MLYHRVLITGANGLLGQSLVRHMSRFPDYDVLATARDDKPRFQDASCGYAPLDITDQDAAKHLLEDFSPSVLINCAAMTQVDDCEEKRDACWEVNTTAVEDLAKLCRQHGARFLQISTDFVFNGENGPYDERARPDPVNFYGRSKLAAENAVREAGVEQWSIARTVLVYGTGRELSRSNIVLWIVESLLDGETIHVVTDQVRTPTYVKDLASGIEKLVRSGQSGTFHFSGREMISVFDFAKVVADVFDLNGDLIQPTTSEELGQRAKRPPKTGFITLKAQTELDYKPRSLRSALQDLRKDIQNGT